MLVKMESPNGDGGSDTLNFIKIISASFSGGSSTYTISCDKKPKSAIWVTGPSTDKSIHIFDLVNLDNGKSKSLQWYRTGSVVEYSSTIYFDNITDSSVTFHYSGYSTSNYGFLILLENEWDFTLDIPVSTSI